ncbi:hypothetical protein HCN44_006049 [Aphidius gifuensis]|uniref:Uncharacterized protein n=1 Tax=Aphidius gifuensis TaxID=684658 RepID=A0A834Y5G5_APHGI|nr:hypothetical protein HCN44_006049 [Aphidius gifuensis]
MMVEIRSENLEESLRALHYGPALEIITEATSHLPPSNPPKSIPSTDCLANFRSTIRKILITLVQASAKILIHSPEATKVFLLSDYCCDYCFAECYPLDQDYICREKEKNIGLEQSQCVKSGAEKLNESGYWKLMSSEPPEVIVYNNKKILKLGKKKQTSFKQELSSIDSFSPSRSETVS